MARPREFDEEEVLDRAVDVFWNCGYEATSIEDLTTALGIRRASLYNAFGDKHTLYLAALDRYRAGGLTGMQDALRDADPVLPAIRALLDGVVAESCGDDRRGCFVVNAVTERAGSDPEVLSRATDSFTRIEGLLRRALERAQDAGELAADASPRMLARFIATQVNGLRVLARAGGSRAAARDVVEIAMRAIA
jgi:TetR/AcrR family transcriptional repressor of nem operon